MRHGIDHLLSAGLSTSLFLLALTFGCDDSPRPPEQPSPLSPADVDEACLRIASCQPEGSPTFEDCIASTMTRPASGLRLDADKLACIEAAGTDCAALQTCLPGTGGDDVCQGRGSESLCQGNLLIRCFAQAVESVTDCAAWGLTCAEEEDLEATCLGPGPSCIPGAQRCDGDEAVLCVGYREATYRCSDLVSGWSCVTENDTIRCAPGDDDACDPRLESATCDEGVIQYCSASGRTASIDCRDLGYAGCADQAGRVICSD